MQIIKFQNQDIQVEPRDEADVSVMREIFKLGEYKAAEEIILSATDPVVDVGAHAGFFTLYCRALNKKVKIFAIEPEPNNLSALQAHLKKNSVKNVEVIAGVLAEETGERVLKIARDSHNHKLASNIPDRDVPGSIKVLAWSLKDFCVKNKIKSISLLKMDIEGGEFEIFESLAPEDYLLFKNVILEYHNTKFRNFRIIETHLRENGFGVQVFPSKFDKHMGFIFAKNKRLK